MGNPDKALKQLLITLMEVLHPVSLLSAPFYVEYHVTVSVAIKAERGKEGRNWLPNGPEKLGFHQADRPLTSFLKRCHLL